MNGKVRKIAFSGILVAISIIFTRFFPINIMIAGVLGIRISFGGIPVMMGGFLMGPLYGALSGILADIIGFAINPMGPYHPGFTLTAALSGFLPGLLAKMKGYSVDWSFRSLLLAIAATELITSLVLNTLWLSMMYDKGFFVFLPGRAVSALLLIPLETLLIKTLHRVSRQFSITDR